MHLRSKAFLVASENAVKTQIWIAISIYVLVAIVKKRLGLDKSIFTILQISSVTLFERRPIYRPSRARDAKTKMSKTANDRICSTNIEQQ